MKISIISVFSEIYSNFLQISLIKRAQEKGLVTYDVTSLMGFVRPKERIDAPIFGPGAGMLIRPEVIEKAIESKEEKYGKAFKIFFSPQGKKLDQNVLKSIYNKVHSINHLILVAARYEGIDARVEQHYADEVISAGEFVLMGGDIPVMMFMEGFLRIVPGVVGKQESVMMESFSGPFVDYPSFTAPVVWRGYEVPEIIRSGNHAAIEKWRTQEAAKKTVLCHFNWMRTQKMSTEQRSAAMNFIPPHYAVLMHTGVLVSDKNSTSETTSVTSMDIHDIARSSKTFGIKSFFIVTPLLDQQKIVKTLLDFWQKGVGIEYNRQRFEALKNVKILGSLDEVVRSIAHEEGKDPLLIATSARMRKKDKQISFYDQALVWNFGRPVLFIFGTGKGLGDKILDGSDFILNPIEGFSEYNHLSVRSAAAIAFDRWLGINVKSSK